MRWLSLGISLPHRLCGGFSWGFAPNRHCEECAARRGNPPPQRAKTAGDCFAALAMTNLGGALRQIEFTTETVRR